MCGLSLDVLSSCSRRFIYKAYIPNHKFVYLFLLAVKVVCRDDLPGRGWGRYRRESPLAEPD